MVRLPCTLGEATLRWPVATSNSSSSRWKVVPVLVVLVLVLVLLLVMLVRVLVRVRVLGREQPMMWTIWWR
jgi:hypothetical protein